MRTKKNLLWFIRLASVAVLCIGLFTGCSCEPGGVDGLESLETKSTLQSDEAIDSFFGSYRAQLSEEQRAKLVNPDDAIIQISLTSDRKIQVIDPVIEMDTSTPMTTYEEIQNAKSVIGFFIICIHSFNNSSLTRFAGKPTTLS